MKHRTGYLHKRGQSWYVSWRVDRKLHMKALRDGKGQPIKTERAAKQARAKFMAPLAMADEAEALSALAAKGGALQARVDEQVEAMPIVRAWSEYMSSTKRPDTGPATLEVYEGQWGQFTDWLAEKRPTVTTLRAVTGDIAEEYAQHLNHGRLAPGTFNKHLNVLALVFRVLADKAKILKNPWLDIQRKRLEVHSRRELTVEELKNVCQGAAGELRTLLALGIYSGLRLKDCATLRWAEVDLARNIIRRVPSKTARRKPDPVLIPIHSALREMLSEIPQDGRRVYVLPETAAKYTEHKKNLINDIQAHFAASGITVHQPGTGENGNRAVVEVGFHSLRHSFVSMCRAADVPLAVVESIVGHSNPAMTRHYTHTGELAAMRAVAALPAVVGKPVEKPAPESVCAQLKSIVKGVKPANLAAKKAELLALLSSF